MYKLKNRCDKVLENKFYTQTFSLSSVLGHCFLDSSLQRDEYTLLCSARQFSGVIFYLCNLSVVKAYL